jgi:hypothetical protein
MSASKQPLPTRILLRRTRVRSCDEDCGNRHGREDGHRNAFEASGSSPPSTALRFAEVFQAATVSAPAMERRR